MATQTLIHYSYLRKAFAIAFLLSLTACGASSGTHINAVQTQDFVAGKTTYREIVEQLGSPTTHKETSDGKTVISYSAADVKLRPETLIPFIGPFVGGADASSHTVSFSFDRKGVLTQSETQDTLTGSSLTAR